MRVLEWTIRLSTSESDSIDANWIYERNQTKTVKTNLIRLPIAMVLVNKRCFAVINIFCKSLTLEFPQRSPLECSKCRFLSQLGYVKEDVTNARVWNLKSWIILTVLITGIGHKSAFWLPLHLTDERVRVNRNGYSGNLWVLRYTFTYNYRRLGED